MSLPPRLGHAGPGAAIVLNSGPPSWEYTLRVNYTSSYGQTGAVPTTTKLTNPFLKTFDSSETGMPYLQAYYYSGFLALQNLVDMYIIQVGGGGAHLEHLVLVMSAQQLVVSRGDG
jgi:hypothetical protein